ncbi:hypothetical protein SYNPS1DRAFT_29854 [Syncephalis pseudoplumigaleata]|uniref:B30.2/SPRY domain-containing protein n=1 Tax=Syncephalis pseudoplumigaleata TaxID=1712513 RepID=A0A4P9YWI6_9FUNG|nr:hypothetical protein SYNPS1DRAFT_29854 [Syncephalis pseudoplumigaleata]|eukprot:RKP24377.1 hypothetical protein SYNPS1DRAFT_29854 [Syncephalis pseudoplumigaleata]
MDISALISPTKEDANLGDEASNYTFSDDSQENAAQSTTTEDASARAGEASNAPVASEATQIAVAAAAAAAAAAERERDDEGASLLLQLAAGGITIPSPEAEAAISPNVTTVSSRTKDAPGHASKEEEEVAAAIVKKEEEEEEAMDVDMDTLERELNAELMEVVAHEPTETEEIEVDVGTVMEAADRVSKTEDVKTDEDGMQLSEMGETKQQQHAGGGGGGTRRHRLRRCYCNRERQTVRRPMITCHRCHVRYHIDCLPVAHHYWKAIVPGDNYFYFVCADCGGGQGREVFQRVQLTWVEAVHLALFTLSHMSPWKERDPMEDGRVYFTTRQDICAMIDSRWEQFWLREHVPVAMWEEQVHEALKAGCKEERFVSGEETFGRPGLWALHTASQFPATYPTSEDIAQRNPAYDILPSGKLAPLADAAQAATSPPVESEGNRSRKRIDADDAKGKGEATTKYKRMKAEVKASKPGTPSTAEQGETIAMYPDLDNPGGPVRLSRQPTHTASRVYVSDDGMSTSNEKGYRMAKATHSVCEGAWYYEARFEGDATSNARIGWSQISGDLQGPCGMDHFSYGYRARPGTVFHQSMGRMMDEHGYAGSGDVLGVLLYIPPLNEAEKADLERRRWTFGAGYEHFRYPLPKSAYLSDEGTTAAATTATTTASAVGKTVMPRVRGSELRYYVNGVLAGVAFTDIFLGRYYPAISCYMKGKVSVNFGPDFEYPPPTEALPNGIRPRAISELETDATTSSGATASPSTEIKVEKEENAAASQEASSAATVCEMLVHSSTPTNDDNHQHHAVSSSTAAAAAAADSSA